MAIGWFVIPYKVHPVLERTRYPAIDDYTADIRAAGGDWSETEVLGDRCVVKVRAPAAGLEQLAAVEGFERLPKDGLNDPLADLPAGVKQALRDELLDMGYTAGEVQARFPDADLAGVTLGDVLRFMATRRRKPRWDAVGEEIVLDGPVQGCRPVDEVDGEISD